MKNLLINVKEYKHASHKVVLEISERPACNCAGKCIGNVKMEERKEIRMGFIHYNITEALFFQLCQYQRSYTDFSQK
jgi:hypothetical protein